MTTCSLLLIAHSEIAALLPSTSGAKIWEHLEGTANDKCHQTTLHLEGYEDVP